MSLENGGSGTSDPANALQLSQQANNVLSRPAPTSSFFPLSLIAVSETPESWTDLERLFLACLRTGDDESAHLSLERLTQRFGSQDERVMGLRGLYQEAVARDNEDLDKILGEYEDILSEKPMNVPIMKRRIALLRSIGQSQAAIEALVEFLEASPTDAEAWCELSDLYQTYGMSSQAVFCLEEALLVVPHAWNLHARLGEIEFMAASATTEAVEGSHSLLVDALRRFSRSIELCDDYLRGYYGLKVASQKLLGMSIPNKTTTTAVPSQDSLRRLNEMATSGLQRCVKTWADQDLPASRQSEIIAAKELLDRSQS